MFQYSTSNGAGRSPIAAAKRSRRDADVERIVERRRFRRQPAFLHQRANRLLHPAGGAEQLAHREHDQRADTLRAPLRQHALADALVHHMKRQHHHVPAVVPHSALRHALVAVVHRVLGDAEEAELALVALAQQRGHDLLDCMIVVAGRQAVDVEHVDAVDAEGAQRFVQRGGHRAHRHGAARLLLGRDDHRAARQFAQRRADDLLGAVIAGGVDEVDAAGDGIASH